MKVRASERKKLKQKELLLTWKQHFQEHLQLLGINRLSIEGVPTFWQTWHCRLQGE
jgi:hypothetical protein